ncbi:hypothetical protein CRM88_10160 [Lactococcus lactis]|nr:hypothetical protein P620_11160 [Lactococcus lactis subsp. lactis KLDS 4.0325]KHE76028.1 hypothetical protein N489_11515 [Lactococcus lactis subsp. lactis 1AA59]MCT3124598.1 hypothetical protein [Lactococcus lactis]PAK66656.1 hypothetical protein B8W94_09515 [Lactococcus lactis]PEN18146.1 hypothetical protein CRM88_10160 [Lactococcus lactis]
MLKVLSIIYGNKKTQISSYKGRYLRVTTFVLFADKIVKLFLAIIAYKSAQFLAIKLLSVNFSSLT